MNAIRKFSSSILMIGVLVLLFSGFQLSCERGRKPVMIEEISPQGEVHVSTNVSIVFTANVVSADSLDRLMDEAPVQIEPPIPGRFKWIDTRTLRFLPTEQLNPATRYRIEVQPSIILNPDEYLKGKRIFEFYTSPVRLQNVSHHIIESDTERGKGKFSLLLQFSEVMDPSVVSDKLGITWQSGRSPHSLGFSVITELPGKDITVETTETPNIDQRGLLLVTMQPGWICVNGNMPVEEEKTVSIPIAAKPQLKVDQVTSGREGDNRFWVSIRFSTPIEMSQVKDFIEFDPPLEFHASPEQTGYSVRLTGNIRPNMAIRVKVLQGLKAKDGSRLESTFSQGVLIEDLPPSVNFASPGMYLSSEGLKNVEIEVVNVDSIHIEVEKIYPNNLVYYLGEGGRGRHWGYGQRIGYRIHEEDIGLAVPKNQTASVTVNFERFLQQNPSGLFRLTVRQVDQYWMNDSKTVLLTDVGMIAKRTSQEVAVWAISTSTLDPLGGVNVVLYSATNQEMARGRTDALGMVRFPLSDVSDEFAPYVIAGTLGEDLSYLMFDQCRVSTSDFDVSGRPTLLSGYEAFLYTDRGVYRPGDSVHVAGIIRGAGVAAPQTFPLRLDILGPDGRIFEQQTSREQDQGMVDFEVDIPQYARTGGYVANIYGAEKLPIGSTKFSVEEFMPDRIKVTIATDKSSYMIGDTMKVDVTGTMLFGPPAAGRKAESSFQIESVPFRPPKWKSYIFGDNRASPVSFKGESIEGKLDAEGKAAFSFALPSDLKPPAAMQIIARGQVQETGGRAVNAYATCDLHAYPVYIGLRRVKDGYSEAGNEEAFRFITLDPAGDPIPYEALRAEFYRVQWRSVLKRDNQGNMRYQSDRWDEFIDAKDLASTGEVGTFEFTPPQWGSYRVVVTEPSSGSTSAITFYVSGYGYAPWSMENPDRIEIELDKKVYSASDEAQALIKAPFSGKMLLTVERDKIYYSRVITLDGNTTTVPIKVKGEYLPNVYVTATLIRSPKSAEKHAPKRAYGTVPLMIDVEGKALSIRVELPEEIRPLRPLNVPVHITDDAQRPAASALVTVALVDEGILQLTGFESPKPMDFFYGKKRLDVNTYDMFAWLLPEVEASELYSAPSGGRAEEARLGHLMPVTVRRVKPVALWSGIVKTNDRGDANITFNIPQFDGRLRAMVVASSREKFGMAEADITVRNPIVLTPTFPRFISSRDEFRVPVTVFNGMGKEADIRLTLEEISPFEIEIYDASRKLTIAEGKEESVEFRIKAGKGMGKVTFVLTAESGKEKVVQSVDMAFRPPSPPISITGSGSASQGNDAVFKMPSNWIPGTVKYSLTMSSLPMIKFAHSLQYLLRYPYGCVEQTTSLAFPLIYYKDLAQVVEPQGFGGNAPEYFVSEAIRKLSSMSLSDGAFSFWPGGQTWNYWGSIYAMHFLVEAKNAGYDVPNYVLRRGWKFLRTVVRDRERRSGYYSGWGHFEPYRFRGGRTEIDKRWMIDNLRMQTYAAYVLALMGEPEKGSMNYFFDEMQDYLQEDSRAFLAGAFALSGDLITAYKLLPVSFKPQTEKAETGGNFNSGTRMEAIILSILADVAPDNPAVPDLIKSLSEKAESRQLHNTQENAWTFMALGKVYRRSGKADYAGVLTVDGTKRADFTAEGLSLTDSTLGDKDIRIVITGEGTCYLYWEARGIPIDQQFEELDNGLRTRRTYVDMNGQPVDLEHLRQGVLYAVKIDIDAPNQRVENVIIDDMLPAGLEIENPRLMTSSTLSWLPKDVDQPDYTDIRDDRMLLFSSLEQKKRRQFVYTVRAVTVGTFVLPPISAECMYDPTLKSVASSGVVVVTP
jgi:uncharacterized protein YfaS (alpha-2-macroglobulin family)